MEKEIGSRGMGKWEDLKIIINNNNNNKAKSKGKF